MTGGLASPPQSHYNQSPQLPVASSSSSSALPLQQLRISPSPPVPGPLEPSPLFLEPSEPEDKMDCCEDGLGGGSPAKLTEEQVSCLGDGVPQLTLEPRSRTSSIGSSLSSLSEMEDDNQPRAGVQSGVESDDSEKEEDESDSENGGDDQENGEGDPENVEDDPENGEDDPMIGVGLEPESSDAEKDVDESALAAQLAQVGLRRSTRNKPSAPVMTPLPLPTVVVMRKPVDKKDPILKKDLVAKKNPILVLVSVWTIAIHA